MFSQITLICLLVAAAHAGDYYAPYAAPSYAHSSVGTQTQSVVRSPDGNSVHSVYSKAVDTPFSSVRKYDSRISNDAIAYGHAPVAYTAPAPIAYHAPVVKTYAAPYAYTAPVVKYTASAPVAYTAPLVKSYAAPYAYSAPVVKAPVAYSAPVSYSPAAVVSHVDFDGLGVHYAF